MQTQESTYDLKSVCDNALEVREFICPRCGQTSTHYVILRSDFLHVDCVPCDLHYFWDWKKENFRELNINEQEFGFPDFKMVE